jgi:preprotein translocase subunit SecD
MASQRKRMPKITQILKRARVIILIAFLLMAVAAINPNPWQTGVAIRGVEKNSSASIAGITNPSANIAPRSREVILSMNNVPIDDEQDYYDFVSTLEPNRTVQIKTDKTTYRLETIAHYGVDDSNKTVLLGIKDLGLSIYNAPTTNIRKGLDLQGGTRVLLQPEEKISAEDMDMVISNMQERLNVYGLSDVVIKETKDLDGNSFVLVEIAGVNADEVKELIAKQGKFESKIGNSTIFRGGGDITYVCRSASCSGIDSQSGCGTNAEGWSCRFRFAISLSPDAAKRQADATSKLDVITEDKNQYLSQKIDLFLDNSLVDSLSIGADLKGKAATDIEISGGGVGKTREEAITDALKNMKRLQTILVTGSLPVKLNVVQTDGVSPVLGKEFISNAILMIALSTLIVAIMILIRYRKIEISIPIMITMISEITLLLGFASLVGSNIDIAAIAGIIVAAGTGVNDQIVITDEVLKGSKSDVSYNWKNKLKNAFFIIMGAYAVTVVSMLPLMFAGAGLIKGFAFTTIVGVSFGVFVTRPAFATMIEILLKK